MQFSYKALTNCINESINRELVPDQLKIASIVPICKAKDPVDKSNNRPISVLPLMSKVHKKVTFKQLSGHANKFRSQILCGLEKFILHSMFFLDYGSVFMKKTIRQFLVCWCSTYVAF